MPTPPNVPNVIRWRILGTLQNLAPWGIRLYSAYTGTTPTSAAILSLAETVVASWTNRIGAYQSNDVFTLQCIGNDLSSDTGASATADTDNSGGVADGSIDNQIAAVVKHVIARRYRGGKPKTFVPGIAASYQADQSHWTTALANDLGSAFAAFNTDIAGMSADGCDLSGLVNVSFYTGFTTPKNEETGRYRNVPTYRAVPLIDTVTSFSCDTLFGSQRRRRLG
jgi:hypothetical protein